jgi:hypothetical protein
MSVELKDSYKLLILNNAEVCGHKSYRTVISECVVVSCKKYEYYCYYSDLIVKTILDCSLKLGNTFVGLS